MTLKVGVACWELFNAQYPPQRIRVQHMDGQHVSDSIGSKEIFQWHQSKNKYPFIYGPVFISAQTGMGKNYFITHTLREYAQRNGEQILYVSNRIALDYQQKKELAKLTHVQIGKPGNNYWADQETFRNVTVLTYQKLYTHLLAGDAKWFAEFTYVVLDECHFFYSDAFFNPHTWDILQMIPQKFKNSIRIYMSATLDDVLEPIRYHEGCEALAEAKSYVAQGIGSREYFAADIDESIFFYEFPRDFGAYNVFAFSKPDQIIAKICNENNNNKWVIFVTNKAKGQDWKKRIDNQAKTPIAAYVDSASRSSTDTHERVTWELLKDNGCFDEKVLITTSVIDNGFSLNDNHIKNIVLFTNDRTEFLQELGRCRLHDGQQINVYFHKLTKTEQEMRRKQYHRFEDVIFRFCGELIQQGFDCVGDPIAATKSLWNSSEDLCREFISLNDTGDGTLRPNINLMARWRTIRLGNQIAEYDTLVEQYHEEAGKIYKQQWLKGDLPASEQRAVTDLDVDERACTINDMRDFLMKTASQGTTFKMHTEEFNCFSIKFQEFYCKIYPRNKNVNRGRQCWGSTAISKRLDEMASESDLKIAYQFEHIGKGKEKEWRVVARE